MLADRWAEAFISCCGRDANSGFSVLKIMLDAVSTIKGEVSGGEAAAQVEKILRAAMKRANIWGSGDEIACRTVALLVKKGQFKHREALVAEIETQLNRKNGIVTALVEAIAPLDDKFKQDLVKTLKQKASANEVRLTERIIPELLGGYRLRVGTVSIDASLRSLLRDMARELG
jgi:F0F1-type ATP synthase delta subunit